MEEKKVRKTLNPEAPAWLPVEWRSTLNPEAPAWEPMDWRSKVDKEASASSSVKTTKEGGVNQQELKKYEKDMPTASLEMAKLADVGNRDITSEEAKKELACFNQLDAGILEVKKPSEGLLDWIRGGGIIEVEAAKAVSKKAGELGVEVKTELAAVNNDQAAMKLEEAVAIKEDAPPRSEEAVKVVLDMRTGKGGHLKASGEVNRKEAPVIFVVKPKEGKQQDALALEEPLDGSSNGLDTSMMTSTPASDENPSAVVNDKQSPVNKGNNQEAMNPADYNKVDLETFHLDKEDDIATNDACSTQVEKPTEVKHQDTFESVQGQLEGFTEVETPLKVAKLFVEAPTSSAVKDVSGNFKERPQIQLAEGSKTVVEEGNAAGEAGPQLKGDLAKPKKGLIRQVPRSVPAGFHATPAAKGTKVQPKTPTANAASGRKTLPGLRTSLGPSIKEKPTNNTGRNSLPPLKAPSKSVQKEAGSANQLPKAIVLPTKVLQSQTRAGAQVRPEGRTSALTTKQAKNAAASVINKAEGLAKDGERKAATKAMASSTQESIGENKENQTVLMTLANDAVLKSNAAANIEGSIEVEKSFMEASSSPVVKDVSGNFKEGNRIQLTEGLQTVLDKGNAAGDVHPQLKDDLAKLKEPILRVPRSVPASFHVTPAAKGTKVQPKTPTAIAASRRTLPGPRTSLGSSIKQVKPTTPASRNSLPPLRTSASRIVQKEAGSANERQIAIVEPTRVLWSKTRAGAQAITSAMKGNQAKNAATSVIQTKGLAKVPTGDRKAAAGVMQVSNGEQNKENQAVLMNPAHEAKRKSNAGANINKESIASKDNKDGASAVCVSTRNVGVSDKAAGTSGSTSINKVGTTPKPVTSKITTVPTPRLSTARLGAASKAGQSHAADKDLKEPVKATPRSVPAGFQLAGSAFKGSKATGVKGKQDDALKAVKAKQTSAAVAQRNEIVRKDEKKH